MIYGLCGASRVGKDTIASLHPEFTRIAFADALKKECNFLVKRYLGSNLNFFDEETKVKYRSLLVGWGEIARDSDPQRWIRMATDDGVPPNSFFTDVRHLNEARYIKSIGGKLVFVYRPHYTGANEEEKKSLSEIINSGIIDFAVVNDGTIDDLKKKTDFVCSTYEEGKQHK